MASTIPITLRRYNGLDWDTIYPKADYSTLVNVPTTFTPTSHTHGNITNAGAIGSTTGLPVVTTTSGVLTVGTTTTYQPYYATINSVASSRNLATSDVNALLTVAGAYTLTIPASTFTIGSQITIARTGASTVTITGAASVYLNGTSAGSTTITTIWKAITLVCYATNYWIALGV